MNRQQLREAFPFLEMSRYLIRDGTLRLINQHSLIFISSGVANGILTIMLVHYSFITESNDCSYNLELICGFNIWSSDEPRNSRMEKEAGASMVWDLDFPTTGTGHNAPTAKECASYPQGFTPIPVKHRATRAARFDVTFLFEA